MKLLLIFLILFQFINANEIDSLLENSNIEFHAVDIKAKFVLLSSMQNLSDEGVSIDAIFSKYIE